jgi:hypothetical protein
MLVHIPDRPNMHTPRLFNALLNGAFRAAIVLSGAMASGACQAGEPARGGLLVAASGAPSAAVPIDRKESRMWMSIGERRFPVTLADTAAARAFAAQLPLTLRMEDLNSNEKHATLPKALPANASRPGTLRNGDLMLYGTDTLVVFYVSFDSPYSYTRIGRVDDPAGLPRAVGSREVQVRFSRD